MTVELESIKRETMPDQDADISWLEQDEFKERLEEYKNDNFYFIGIRATAQIRVNGISQTITSAGLWGIESDSNQPYFDEVYQEELSTLRDILLELGVTKENLYKVNGL